MKPASPGYYWYKLKSDRWIIVEITESIPYNSFDGEPWLTAWYCGNEEPDYPKVMDGEWGARIER